MKILLRFIIVFGMLSYGTWAGMEYLTQQGYLPDRAIVTGANLPPRVLGLIQQNAPLEKDETILYYYANHAYIHEHDMNVVTNKRLISVYRDTDGQNFLHSQFNVDHLYHSNIVELEKDPDNADAITVYAADNNDLTLYLPDRDSHRQEVIDYLNLQAKRNDLKPLVKRYIGKKAPALHVEKWLSQVPNTEGKYILLDFWATWCKPCRKSIPEMNEYYAKYGKDLVVIGISDEQESTINEFSKDIPIDYFSAIDSSKQLYDYYQVSSIPHVVLIDPEGKIRWKGFPDRSQDALDEQVLQAFLYEG